MWDFLKSLVDDSKIAGWVRAGVAALVGLLVTKWPALSGILSPDLVSAVGVAAAAFVVGIWSSLTKPTVTETKVAGPVIPSAVPAAAAATIAAENPKT